MDQTRSDLGFALQHVRRIGIGLVLILVLLYLLSGLYTLAPDETGVLLRFGRVVDDRISSGLGYRFPWPVDRLDRVKVSEVKRMSVGYRIVDRVRGLPPREEESRFLTGDENIIQVEMMVQYQVQSPREFLYRVDGAPFLVRRCVEHAVCHRLASLPVDEVLTRGKATLERQVKEEAQILLDRYRSGVLLVAAHLQEVRPPPAVADAFHDVASAREDRNRYIDEARGYTNREIPKARGAAAVILEEGEALKQEATYRARGEVDRFQALALEHDQAPRITRIRLYREAMERILSRARTYLTDAELGEKVQLRLMRNTPGP